MSPRVGQSKVSFGVEVNGGTYAMSAIPVMLKSFPQVVTLIPSGLVKRKVKTRNQSGLDETD